MKRYDLELKKDVFVDYVDNKFDTILEAGYNLGVSESVIHSLKSGRRKPSSSTIAHLIKNTDFEFKDLFEVKEVDSDGRRRKTYDTTE